MVLKQKNQRLFGFNQIIGRELFFDDVYGMDNISRDYGRRYKTVKIDKNINTNMKKNYILPAVEIISVSVERGFADSLNTGIKDFTFGDTDSMDD